jgi:hypothetical protein
MTKCKLCQRDAHDGRELCLQHDFEITMQSVHALRTGNPQPCGHDSAALDIRSGQVFCRECDLIAARLEFYAKRDDDY